MNTSIKGQKPTTRNQHLNPLANIVQDFPILKCYLFRFHDFFDGLISFELFRGMGALVDAAFNTITINNQTIQLKKKFPSTEQIHFHENETLVKQFTVRINEGDFLIQIDTLIQEDVIIPSGVHSAQKDTAKFPIINLSNKGVEVCMDKETISTELCNFEEISTEPFNTNTKNNKTRSLMEKDIRPDHLNSEQKDKLFNILKQFPEVLHSNDEKLSITNALPIYSKNYRYPLCHREEVQRQIVKMLDQGIIRPSSSPWSPPIKD